MVFLNGLKGGENKIVGFCIFLRAKVKCLRCERKGKKYMACEFFVLGRGRGM